MSFDLSSLDASPEDRDAQQIKTLRARRDQLTERRSSYLGGIVFVVVLAACPISHGSKQEFTVLAA